MNISIFACDTLILGCGNLLFGDDGFGPEVIASLEQGQPLPSEALCFDAGTSVREILFDLLLSPVRPRRLILIDAAERPGMVPGDIAEIDLDEVSVAKSADFSLHQFPTTNMLHELRAATPMEIRLLVVQVSTIPDQVAPGLSEPVHRAVERMDRLIRSLLAQRELSAIACSAHPAP
jgi:coenzyme F420 hydrogenase subunit delta